MVRHVVRWSQSRWVGQSQARAHSSERPVDQLTDWPKLTASLQCTTARATWQFDNEWEYPYN